MRRKIIRCAHSLLLCTRACSENKQNYRKVIKSALQRQTSSLIPFFLLCVLKVRPIGYDGNNPTSVAEWLESLELGDYTKSFLVNGYTSMELVKKIWEIELINVSLQC